MQGHQRETIVEAQIGEQQPGTWEHARVGLAPSPAQLTEEQKKS